MARISKSPRMIVPPPGQKAKRYVKMDEELISPSYGRFYPLVVQSGKGSLVKDMDGNEFIDFNSGLVCMNVGHCHPKVVSAIKKQAEKLLHYSFTDFYYEEALDLAKTLTEITPGRFRKRVYYGNSGTEAVEAAMKVARWHTRRPRFMAYMGAFHGRTLGSLSLTGSKPVQRRHFAPLLPETTHVPYANCYRCPFKMTYPECGLYCVDFIEDFYFKKFLPPEEVAALFFEPIQGEGGYVVPPADYFKRIKKLMDKYGILMVDDEVQSGMGRSARWFAVEHFGIEPDILCSSKALASGLPLGATIARSELMDWEKGSHASTFGGNPVCCAAANSVIDVIREEDLLKKAEKNGHDIMKRFNEVKAKCDLVGDVRGKGLMIGVELVKDGETKEPASKEAQEVMMRSWRKGVAVITAGTSTIRIAPPLNTPKELLEAGLDIIEESLISVSKEM